MDQRKKSALYDAIILVFTLLFAGIIFLIGFGIYLFLNLFESAVSFSRYFFNSILITGIFPLWYYCIFILITLRFWKSGLLIAFLYGLLSTFSLLPNYLVLSSLGYMNTFSFLLEYLLPLIAVLITIFTRKFIKKKGTTYFIPVLSIIVFHFIINFSFDLFHNIGFIFAYSLMIVPYFVSKGLHKLFDIFTIRSVNQD